MILYDKTDFENEDDFNKTIKNICSNGKENIVFYSPWSLPIYGTVLDDKPLGGTETMVVHLARGLSDDYNVLVIGDCPKPGIYSNVIYADVSAVGILNYIDVDVAIQYKIIPHRFIKEFVKKVKPKKFIAWIHDYPMYHDFNASFMASMLLFDALVCVSNDHISALLARYPLCVEEDKLSAVVHGVNMDLYSERETTKRVKNQFYYCSTPFRGLEVLVKMFPKIRERVPDATLKVCSSLEVYNQPNNKDYDKLYKICRDTPGIEYVGNVIQKDLAKIAMESEFMLFPSIFAETCGIVVLEAQAAGTPIICNDLGALKETVHEGCGIILKGNPYREKWQDEFVDVVVDACNDKDNWDKMNKTCLEQDFSLETFVENWKKLLCDLK